MAEEKQRPSLIQRVETIGSVIERLLETLAGLNDKELENFREVLWGQTDFHRHWSDIQWRLLMTADMQDTVFLMVQNDSQQSVKTAMEVLEMMKRTDLVQRLSDSSSGSKKKHSDEHRSTLIQKVATMAAVKQLLLETLNDLSGEELEKFKKFLERIISEKNLTEMSSPFRLTEDRAEIVDVMLQTYSQQSVQLTREAVKEMNRTDLMQRLSDSSSELEEKHPEGEHQPEVLEEAVPKSAVKRILLETLKDLSSKVLEKFKLFMQFTYFQKGLPHISWSQLEQAGSAEALVNLMVENQQSVEMTKEVFMDMNRIDLVKKLSTISARIRGYDLPIKVSLPKAALLKFGFSVKVNCAVLIYKTNKPFLNFHVYLIPQDPLLQEEVDRRELSNGSTRILKPHPQKPLKMRDHFILTADVDGAKIFPDKVKLGRSPDFFEVFIENPDKVFKLQLERENDHQPVWTCQIRKVDYQRSTGPLQGSERTRPLVIIRRMKRRSLDISAPEKHQSEPLHKEVTVTPIMEKLLETLKKLRYHEFEHFKWLLEHTARMKGLPRIPRQSMETADRVEIAALMEEIYGKQSVEVAREVLMEMGRIDLVECLPEISSGSKERQKSELLHKKVTVTPLMAKLWETLEELRYDEFEDFKWLLEHTARCKGLPKIPRRSTETADRVEIVALMEEIYGKQSVEVAREVLMEMGRINLVEWWPEISSGSKEKHWSKPLHKKVTVTPLMEKLLKKLKKLRYDEFEEFKWLLEHTAMRKGLPKIPTWSMETADRVEIADLMGKIYGKQSVEVAREVLMEVGRIDLVEWLPEISSGSKEKHWSKPLHKEVTVTPLMEKLLETLKELRYDEFEDFKWLLELTAMKKGVPRIPRQSMKTADRVEIAALMEEIYGKQSVEVAREVLMKVGRIDLVEWWPEISSESKGPSRSLELEGCGTITQDSSDWTKVEPEVNRTDADEASTYSLQSEAGNFECSVSGLRWACKEKVSFKYQFCSLSGHMERIESGRYMPAGPLMDITVIDGKLDVVYLPHWICIDDNPTILDKFAVLHIDDCGHVLIKVSEVTSSHVKLSDPQFSLVMVLLESVGPPVEIYCKVLIYSRIFTGSSQTTLTLHVYLIPSDPGLEERLDSREKECKGILNPKLEKPLKMGDKFILTTDQEGAEIYPEGEEPQTIMLRHDSTDPNFYKVIVENPDKNLKLTLTPTNGDQPIWTCKILEGEWQSTGHKQEKHSVVKHQEAADRKKLLKMLKGLGDTEFKEFKCLLPGIANSKLENSDRVDIVNLMLQTYTHKCAEVAKEILEEIERNDLVKLFSDTSLGSEAAGSSA